MQAVVIIDDSELNLTLLRHFVAQLGDCAAHSFTVPEQGLAHCLQQTPDLLIIDYMMPGLNGVELLRRFRATPACANIPVLMITASDVTQIRYLALESGANDFLSKPLDRIEFLARARNMLALRSSQKQLEERASWLAAEVAKATQEILRREQETILRLSRAAEFRDPQTGAHVQRMAHYAWMIGARLGLPSEQQQLLLEAAPMHDVGKVGIPDHILLKPGRLDAAELSIMQEHAAIGHHILSGSHSPLLQMAAEIALSHHEKYDGSGYPHGLVGTSIPVAARIVAVADVFDALVSERPYKRAWAVPQAVAFLTEQRGQHFDPDCIDAFLSDFDAVLEARASFAD